MIVVSSNALLFSFDVVFAVPPERPIILDSNRGIPKIEEAYNEGSDVNLICESRGGRPPPRLTWYLENTVIDDTYHYKGESEVTVNHLAYRKVGRQHLKARLICQASNTNLVPPQTMLLILDVNRELSSTSSTQQFHLRRNPLARNTPPRLCYARQHLIAPAVRNFVAAHALRTLRHYSQSPVFLQLGHFRFREIGGSISYLEKKLTKKIINFFCAGREVH